MMEEVISYSLVRSKKRRRTMSIQIMPDGRVVIRAPSRTPQAEIDRFFKTRSAWLQKKLLERERLPGGDAVKPPRFTPGEKFLYLGEWYPLEVQDRNGRKAPLMLSWGTFILDAGRTVEAKDLFARWYKDEARKLLSDRVNHYGKCLNLFPSGITITSAQFRYGSCSPKNRLSFSWKLIMAPLPVIDYIVVHELIHIKEKNHSRRFWVSVEAAMPDYKKYRVWLRENHHLLAAFSPKPYAIGIR